MSEQRIRRETIAPFVGIHDTEPDDLRIKQRLVRPRSHDDLMDDSYWSTEGSTEKQEIPAPVFSAGIRRLELAILVGAGVVALSVVALALLR